VTANLAPSVRRAVEAAEAKVIEREAFGSFGKRFLKWHDDPIGFQADVLGRRLWSKQEDVCRAIARHDITVVPAWRAVGKSFLLAGIVLWFVATR